MTKRLLLIGFVLLLIVVGSIAQDDGNTITAPDPDAYEWEEVASGFDNPLYLTTADDGSGRLFVVEQTGYILIIEDGEWDLTPFLDLSGELTPDVFQGGYTERGLIGLVFHPEYEENGYFWVHYINREGNQVISRFTVSEDDPNRADRDSEVVYLTFEDVFDNHNGGQLAFGPDGMLYIGIGDGGNLGDPLGHGQDTSVYFGKMLRVDVDRIEDRYVVPASNPFSGEDGYRSEIWATGLRNPWRFSFDSETGDLYIGDVGESAWEEINFQPADSTGGENYGWSHFEGEGVFAAEQPEPAEPVFPVAGYSHSEGCSITGGYVYRGEAMPELDGVYFYGDYCNGRTWTTFRDEDGEWQINPFHETERQISSFGLDENGELYMVDYKGGIYKLVAAG